ncbi:MAG TPA: hypothetical protein VFK69_01090, partial [Candidatus Eisenbacteria bacterium]|nr:hypothetical protein [Candidatus Eisenbacteria bacterium]
MFATVATLAALRVAPDALPRFEVRVPWSGGAPTSREWQDSHAGVRAVQDRAGHALIVRSGSGAKARDAASALVLARAAGIDAWQARRERLEARWSVEVLPAPRPML